MQLNDGLDLKRCIGCDLDEGKFGGLEIILMLV